MNDDEFRWKLASDSVHLVLWWAACISLHSNGRYGSALTGVSGRKNWNNQVIMVDACSLSKEGLLDCGSSRGRTETVFLYECRDDVTTHLKIVFFRMQTWKNTRSSCKGLASTVCLMKKWKHYVFVLAIAMVWTSTGGLQSCVSIQGTKDHLPASKVVTWSTLPWPRRCFSCLIYQCRKAHVRIKHTTFGVFLCHNFHILQCLSHRVFLITFLLSFH